MKKLPVAGIAVLSAWLAACSSSAPPATPPPPLVVVKKIAPAEARVTIDYVAQTEALNEVEIRPRVGGLLETQAAVEGTRVKKGQLLFVIDAQPYEAAVAQAKASLALAQSAFDQADRDLARVKPLSTIDAVSQQELDAAIARHDASNAQVEAARAALQTAQLNLGYTRITSPIDGVIGPRAAQGRRPRHRLHNAADDGLFDRSDVRELRDQRIAGAGDPARDGRGAGPGRQEQPHLQGAARRWFGVPSSRPAELHRCGGRQRHRHAEAAAGSAESRSAAARQPVRPAVRVTTQNLKDALLVPQRAVQEFQGKNYVWVIDAESKAQQRDVTMGARVDASWIVTKGLSAGEVLVVEGMQKLKPGAAVSTRDADAAPAPAQAPTPAAKS